jgi:hypothetical protein
MEISTMSKTGRLVARGVIVASSAMAFGGFALLAAPAASADTPAPWAPPGCVVYSQPQSNSVGGFLLEGIAGDTSQTTTYCDNRGGAATADTACTADTAATAATPDVPGAPGVPGTCSTGQKSAAASGMRNDEEPLASASANVANPDLPAAPVE